MTTGGGVAGPSEQDVTELMIEPTEDGVSRLTPPRHECHLRIVHSVDRASGFAQALHNRSHPVPDRPAEDGTNGGTDTQAMIDRGIQSQIGSMLRDVFADVASEPVPSRFVELLDALAAQEKQR